MTTTPTATIDEVKYLPSGSIVARAICGKQAATVLIMEHQVNVICENASHRCYRRGGRVFDSMPDALRHYKSKEMQAIITAIDGLNH
jgi:hypothetical protein